MPIDEFSRPVPTFRIKDPSMVWVSTILSSGAAAAVTGSTIDVRGLRNVTAYVTRGVSANQVELEVSPDGSNWWQWKNFATGAIVSAGDKAVLADAQGANFVVSYVRAGSWTFSSGNVVVRLNALT